MKPAVPTFLTPRLILKEICLADVPSYEKHFIDYEVIRYLSSAVPWPYPVDGVENYFKKFVFPELGVKRWTWGIFLKENPSEVIGMIELFHDGKPEHRGFWLGRAYWGQGIMTEAVSPVMDYAFNELGFEKLVFSNAVGNFKSRRVKEKTGARLIGTRPVNHVDPQLTESETWELSRSEWVAFKNG